ncbi:MAG: imidazolonepropionase [Candidatus Aminicenantales bacterium]
MKSADLVIRGLKQLVTCRGPIPKRKRAMLDLGIIERAAIASAEGKIIYVGPDEGLEAEVRVAEGAIVLEADGLVGFPGFVDPHTHLPFAGTREEEFLLRLRGATYQELAARGLGIQTSVQATRAIPSQELTQECFKRLTSMLLLGTTTIEAKSGYGLNLETEIKQLQVLQELQKNHPVEIIPTFLGAHEVPPEFKSNKSAYIKLLVNEILPAIKEKGLAEFIDIFCEEGVYSPQETRLIAEAGHRLGLKIRLHADEFSSLGGAELAVDLGAVSADHLIHVSPKGIEALASSNTTAILLPVVPLFLRLGQIPPARQLIDAGAIVAIATDFNPGSSMTESMLLACQLAVFLLGFQVEEAITAATANAAYALQRHERLGSLEPGKDMDLILCSMPNYIHLIYHPGPNPIVHVFKKGKWVVREGIFKLS